MQENAHAKGRLSIRLYGPDGKLKDERIVENLIVSTGRAWLAQRMTGAPALMSHMAIGIDNTAPSLSNTGLMSESTRVALSAQQTVDNVTTYDATFPAGVGTGAIVEAGIFNAAIAGTMLNRAIFAVVNKGASDVMSITWTITQQ